MKRYDSASHRDYRSRVSSRALKSVPRRGLFCVMDEADHRRPLACHAVFQEALEDEAIPPDQGINSRGNKRDVRCDGTLITGTKRVPYVRRDGRPIFQITSCTNNTKKQVWLGGDWTDVEDALDGYSFREFIGHPLYAVVIGVGLAALAASLRNR